MSIWTDIWSNLNLFANASEQNYPGIATTLPQTPEGQQIVNYSGFFGGLIGFLDALTDVSTWRSLGWILLGAILIIAGVFLWLRQNDLIPKTQPVPVPVPL